MCGRTAITRTAHQLLHSTYDITNNNTIIYSTSIKDKISYPQYNVGPYNYLPVIRTIQTHRNSSVQSTIDDRMEPSDELINENQYQTDQSYTDYSVEQSNNELSISKQHTITKYTCDDKLHNQCALTDIPDTTVDMAQLIELDELTDQRVLHIMRWGLLPSYTKRDQLYDKAPYVLINARSETVTHKSMFKQLVESQRCIIVVDCFYEWLDIVDTSTGKVTGKHPYAIHMPVNDDVIKSPAATNGPVYPPPMYFAGIYECWTDHTHNKTSKPSDNKVDIKLDHSDRISDIYTCTILTCEPSNELDWLHDRYVILEQLIYIINNLY